MTRTAETDTEDEADHGPMTYRKALNALEPRQRKFVVAYLKTLNATQSAITAGYAKGSAHVQGCRLLMNHKVAEAVRLGKAEQFRRMHMEADEVLALVADQARGVMQHMAHFTPDGDPYLDASKADPSVLQHVKKMTIEDFTDGREIDDEGNVIKRNVRRVMMEVVDPGDARKTLMKHLGLLTEKVEHSLSDGFVDAMLRGQQRVKRGRTNDEG
jgi:phage terminase small subunit